MGNLTLFKEQTTLLINTIKSENRMMLATIEAGLTISTAADGTLLRTLQHQNEEEILTVVVFLIKKMNDGFSLPPEKKLNVAQIYDLAVDLLDVFGYETLEDLTLMLKMVRQGKIGGVIHRFDGNIVLSQWVPAYLDLKAEHHEAKHALMKKQLHEAVTVTNEPDEVPEDQKAIYREKLATLVKELTHDRLQKRAAYFKLNNTLKTDLQRYIASLRNVSLDSLTKYEEKLKDDKNIHDDFKKALAQVIVCRKSYKMLVIKK